MSENKKDAGTTKGSDELVSEASAWWSTKIVDIEPGHIRLRGYPVEELIGEISFPSMIWMMLKGELPSKPQAHLLEAALVASVDHGPQAPSISIARMAATCGVGINNAMASGINALGDVHGGAGQQCLELYRSFIEEAKNNKSEDVEKIIEARLEKIKRVPGFGHRFHPVDPRAAPLLALVAEAVRYGHVGGDYLRVAQGISSVMTRVKKKSIPMNIDGATAVIFGELGFDPQEARGLFILSRSVGILAHASEQMQQGGRIKGPMPTSIPYSYDGNARRSFRGQE